MFVVFLLGRPGCGKSEIFRRISEKLKEEKIADDFFRLDDFPKLWAIFQEDEKSGRWRYSRPTPDGGYKVTDDRVWDLILQQLNEDIRKEMRPKRIIFVEFSRPNYLHSLKNFSEEILKRSLIIYINCSFETCWERNVRRHKAALAKGTDDHLVSREEMEKTYLYDDREELLKNPLYPVVEIDNEKEGTEHLILAAKQVVEKIKEMLKGDVRKE